MKIRVFVVDEKTEVWDEGKSSAQVLICQDWSPSGERLNNTFDYNLRDTELAAYSHKLVEQKFDLIVTELTSGFSGRFRARGRIVAETLRLPLPEKPAVAGK